MPDAATSREGIELAARPGGVSAGRPADRGGGVGVDGVTEVVVDSVEAKARSPLRGVARRNLYGLDPDAAVASIVHTACLITETTLSRAGLNSI